jgi:hypothetical protein
MLLRCTTLLGVDHSSFWEFQQAGGLEHKDDCLSVRLIADPSRWVAMRVLNIDHHEGEGWCYARFDVIREAVREGRPRFGAERS